MDHSRALGHPADAHVAAAQIRLQSDLLSHQIGGENGSSCSGPTLGTEGRHQGIKTRQQGAHRNRHADHTGGADQHLFRRQTQPIGDGLGGPQAIDQAPVAGAGIGLAGIGEHHPGMTAGGRQALGAEVHAGGTHHRGGEGAGAHGALRRQQQGKVGLAGGLEARGYTSGQKATGSGDATGDWVPGMGHGLQLLRT